MIRRIRILRLGLIDFLQDLRDGTLQIGPIVVSTRDSYVRTIQAVSRDELTGVRDDVEKRMSNLAYDRDERED